MPYSSSCERVNSETHSPYLCNHQLLCQLPHSASVFSLNFLKTSWSKILHIQHCTSLQQHPLSIIKIPWSQILELRKTSNSIIMVEMHYPMHCCELRDIDLLLKVMWCSQQEILLGLKRADVEKSYSVALTRGLSR